MSKGFGFHREKRLLSKVIETQDAAKFQALVQKLVSTYGAERVSDWVVQDILPFLDSESMSWTYTIMCGQDSFKKITEQSLENVFQVLIKKGFVPGTDFSVHPQGGFILSEDCNEALLEDIPEEHREKFRAETLQAQAVDPQVVLENHLKVPFVANLLSRVEARIPDMTDSQAAGYLTCLGVGVEERTQIELFPILIRHIQQRFPDRLQSIWKVVKSERWDEPGAEVGIDLVIAAGGESELVPDPSTPGNYFINRRGLEILATVYQGERSIYDLIASLDAR